MPITKRKILYHLNLSKELDRLKTAKQKTEAKNRIAAHILENIETFTQAGVSPVTGQNFKKLDPKYAKIKKKKTGSGEPDLHLTNKMIPSIHSQNKATGIDFKITDATEKKKFYNHNVGDTLPKRQALPDDKEKFTGNITKGIAQIIRDIKSGS